MGPTPWISFLRYAKLLKYHGTHKDTPSGTFPSLSPPHKFWLEGNLTQDLPQSMIATVDVTTQSVRVEVLQRGSARLR